MIDLSILVRKNSLSMIPKICLMPRSKTTFTYGLTNETICSYTLNTIPPENTNLDSLIVLPFQKPDTPNSCQTPLAASMVPAPFALCVRVLIVSNGWVAYTVTIPATAPVPNVVAEFWGRFRDLDISLSWL